MMPLGRNTVQWLGGLAVVLALIASSFPGLSDTARQVLAFVTGLDAAAVLWITQTSVTPIASPRLAAGIKVTVLDPTTGEMLGAVPLPLPGMTVTGAVIGTIKP